MDPPGETHIKDTAAPGLDIPHTVCLGYYMFLWAAFLIISVLWLADHLVDDRQKSTNVSNREGKARPSARATQTSQSQTSQKRTGSKRGDTPTSKNSMSTKTFSFQVTASGEIPIGDFASPNHEGDDSVPEAQGGTDSIPPEGAATRCTCGNNSRKRPKSWGEERWKEREKEKEKEKEPTSVFYYLGKLVQVVGSKNVQVGNENVMYQSEAAAEDLDESYEPCTHCQKRSTADRATSMTSMCDTGVHTPCDVTDTADDTRDSAEEDDSTSVSDVSCMSPTGTLSNIDSKKQLFIDARIRIYRAAEELRKPQSLNSKDKEHPLRRSLSKLSILSPKKSKSSEANKGSVFYT